jgi:hypothetical protein
MLSIRHGQVVLLISLAENEYRILALITHHQYHSRAGQRSITELLPPTTQPDTTLLEGSRLYTAVKQINRNVKCAYFIEHKNYRLPELSFLSQFLASKYC